MSTRQNMRINHTLFVKTYLRSIILILVKHKLIRYLIMKHCIYLVINGFNRGNFKENDSLVVEKYLKIF